MPKRKFHTLHDDGSIFKERRHRARNLREQRRFRRELEEMLADWRVAGTDVRPDQPTEGDSSE